MAISAAWPPSVWLTATRISPWIVMKAALELFRTATPAREVPLLPHLQEPGPMLYNTALEVGPDPRRRTETCYQPYQLC